eukprot:CAMPEP_0184647944 /NCGR_PEP_ID=MMETSP0308-20130426/4991_1 /TAXON_ID=38269 /ORGANISM="Gloeochaete witrockiana, Strain SAG 46.84" /LENGTH=1014 /DNA_ID=CAMNT_0027079379 /DNA_START=1 /DNA_END=3045 /DNA_ORIENTATION=-
MAAARLSALSRSRLVPWTCITSDPPCSWRQKRLYAAAAVAAPVKPKAKPPHPSESFLSGTNGIIIEQLYDQWLEDPSKVHRSWDQFFRNVDAGLKPGEAYSPAPRSFYERLGPGRLLPSGAAEEIEKEFDATQIEESLKVLQLIRSYRERGHLIANLDPLKLMKVNLHPDLDPAAHGFGEEHMDRQFFVGGEFGQQVLTLREILERVRKAYCGTLAVEYMHISDRTQKFWVRAKFEKEVMYQFTREEKEKIYKWLAMADSFERFLANKYSTAKRFGLEGAECMIPGLEACLERASELGIENVVVGMPHRGRLNVLANVMKKPLAAIFSEFQAAVSKSAEVGMLGSGDVKYHLGTSADRTLANGLHVHLSLTANPSHLEAVDPVVVGKTRAKQFFKKDINRNRVMSILLHGDAAFAGQGVVAETLELADLKDYTTGGTIHIIVNNQIGFTTDPRKARSSPYCSDVAKIVGAPILHVNGDDPEAVVHACRIAAEFRQTFKKDVVVDIVCYRRHGHNELDQPAFTQPHMYKKIAAHPPTLKLYSQELAKQAVMPLDVSESVVKSIMNEFEGEFRKAKTFEGKRSDWLSTNWEGFKSWLHLSKIRPTGVSLDLLKRVGLATTRLPEGFNVHPKIRDILEQRKKMMETGEGIDWSCGEALAYGTLLLEGFHIRLSGQDVERGTFSHRHAVLHDQKTDGEYVPLNNIEPAQAVFDVCNSNLSEFAVLGFEHGYSLESPYALVLWEAQFGDFANGAQVIIDQFIASGESKWLRQSGLTLLLPHGYDGQGPEHSSCRVERFLQLSDEPPDELPVLGPNSRQIQERNIQVVNCTTPANFFHAIRRQLHREFRKPLIVVTPKNLLRHRKAISTLEDFAPGTLFQKVIRESADDLVEEEKVRRVVFCAGKVYYDLLDEREKRGIKDIAIVRVEQYTPFPFDLVEDEAGRFPNAEIVWCQEEPQNMGAWTYVEPRFITAFSQSCKRIPFYAGRKPSASPATGSIAVHEREFAEFSGRALSDKPLLQ